MPIRTSEMPLIAKPVPSVPVKRLQNLKTRPIPIPQIDTPRKQDIKLSGGSNVVKVDIRI